jgi:adenylate kinase
MRKPTILVTGTPGTGKSKLSKALPLQHLELSKIIQDHSLFDEKDLERDAFILDEDLVLDYLETLDLQGTVIDSHVCDFFPPEWFDLIVVLSADTHILYDRLVERKYPLSKVQENVQCEIMMEVKMDAMDAFQDHVEIMELSSNSDQDFKQNCEKLNSWIQDFITQHNDSPLQD